MTNKMLGYRWVIWYYIRMLTYFDECYDGGHSYLILGVLYNPSVGKIHNDFLKRKRDEKYFKTDGTVQEIKYNYCVNTKRFRVARGAVDCFRDSSSFFRAIVIDQRPNQVSIWISSGEPMNPRI